MANNKLLDWHSKTVVVAASGPSLAIEQLAEIPDSAKLIVTNSTFRLAPFADVIFGVDFLYWKMHIDEIGRAGLRDKCWTCDRAASERWQLNYVRNIAREGLGTKDLCTGGNSGYAAINLAYLFGARRILLLGFDMRDVDGRKHWHADHPSPCVQKHQFGEWIHKFKKLAEELKAADCEVVNCTPGSALNWFRMSTIEKEL
jgi:hypothetical protein